MFIAPLKALDVSDVPYFLEVLLVLRGVLMKLAPSPELPECLWEAYLS